jgi:hypothetical protein
MFCSFEESEATERLRAAIEEHLGGKQLCFAVSQVAVYCQDADPQTKQEAGEGLMLGDTLVGHTASQSAGSPAHSW